MLFTSAVFLAFLPIVLLLFYLVPRRLRIPLLLVASYVFYGWWNWQLLGLILTSTFVDFGAAIGIEAERKRGGTGKRWMILSVIVNLSILGFFKYFNFFWENLVEGLAAFGVQAPGRMWEIILPVGISFYTFQSMAYTIDVYRGVASACRKPLTFMLYVVYFPQLVAGPIERPNHLIPQLEEPAAPRTHFIMKGAALILLGYFKKVAVADGMAPYVDAIYASPKDQPSAVLLAGMVLFSIQLYMDFSAYVDIARGVSRLFGIELMKNFEQPYLSITVTEFWRRWHMSLSFWMRDYLYIPLGGNRGSEIRVSFNLFATLVLAGLWHGAAWTFVLFGVLHGIYLVVERILEHRGIAPAAQAPRTQWGVIIRRTITLILVIIGFTVFRCDSIGSFGEYMEGIFRWVPADFAEYRWTFVWLAATLAVTLYIDIMQVRTGAHEFLLKIRPLYGALVAGMMILAIIYWSDKAGVPFYYFQF